MRLASPRLPRADHSFLTLTLTLTRRSLRPAADQTFLPLACLPACLRACLPTCLPACLPACLPPLASPRLSSPRSPRLSSPPARGRHSTRGADSLSNVMKALSTQSSFVPYRDSKLTHMLSDALGGNCRTSLVICVSPATADCSETTGALEFGAVRNCNAGPWPR